MGTRTHWIVLAAMLALVGCDGTKAAPAAPETAATSPSPAPPTAAAEAAMAATEDDDIPLVKPSDPPTFQFPQRRIADGYTVVLYAPQFRRWDDFERIEAWSALKLTSPDGKTVRYGTVALSGDTDIDLDRRIVTITKPHVDDVVFVGTSTDAEKNAIMDMATRQKIEVPVELILAHLTDDVLDKPPPPGFSTKPPKIVVVDTPTVLLFVNGQEPVANDIADTGLKLVVNANWPVFLDAASNTYFFLNDDQWLTAKALGGPWTPTVSLPAGFDKLPKDQGLQSVQEALPPRRSDEPAPAVILANEPTELIVTDGAPVLETIPGTEGLEYVKNTSSPLFRNGKQWYYLVSGRWFATNDLAKGPWKFVKDLPRGFAQIPADSPMAAVRASVPDTVEARFAALESSIPTKTKVAVGTKAPVEVSYIGEPKFEPITGTKVSRAVNSSNDVILFDGQYYLCYSGVWYVGAAPTGPFTVATAVPDEIYKIPPSSPSYQVTQVAVAESTPTEVVYTYPPSYSESVWVVWGVPYYGTGWYYPPYCCGYYYPYWGGGSYGHGSWYNPVTGGFGSRSVWYGPYGGYSYTQGYNPRTGRYGYSEAAWDGSGWAQYGEKYNPRTGVHTKTSRDYDYSSDEYHAERNRTGPNGGTTAMDRKVDFQTGNSQVKRNTSNGGSSTMNRSWDDGQMTSSGKITTGDGRSATISGEHTLAGGTTTITGSEGGSGTITRENTAAGANRQGSFTNANGDTITTDTTRRGTSSKTDFETSNGGSGTSIKNDGNRTTIGQSGSGDIYAGHNGNVYKKTDDGWQKYDADNGWQGVQTEELKPSRSATESGSTRDPRNSAQTRSNETLGSGSYRGTYDRSNSDRSNSDRGTYDRGSSGGNRSYDRSNDMRQLNRDYNARQMGTQRSMQRMGGGMRGGGMRGGGRRR